ncbi:MAG: energy transducer TonB [Acidobacteriia bacterium]|nr:energy transducer TonB [Terriglobia bacterium]
MIAAILTIALAVFAPEQDPMTAARELYASAAYEDALAMLNRLPQANRPADEARTIEQYRAFCLLALGRTAEAEHAIEAVVSGAPMYQPAAADVSPRVRAAFSDVRRRMLPGIIQQQYARAKAAYDHKDFAAASSGFERVLEVMGDPDVATAITQSPLSDLRMLATDFHDLAVTAATPPPPPPAPAPAPAPAAPVAPRIYTPNDAAVVPPIVMRQELPPYPGLLPAEKQGIIEVVIDETGAVEAAVMRQKVSPAYDALALNAAKTWRYRPASVDGVPVKFRKAITITVKPHL